MPTGPSDRIEQLGSWRLSWAAAWWTATVKMQVRPSIEVDFQLRACGWCVARLAAPKWERAAARDVMARDCLARHRRVLGASSACPIHLRLPSPAHTTPTPLVPCLRRRLCCNCQTRYTAGTMPADIRSFFGGGAKASQGSQGSQKKDEVR